ncbi:ABC transporter ATP-binding protein [Liquorilactobacillus sicerae]|uniref:ABC transporter ATP-binding protein n=1 Tax=Liquorilactobacillus sicerae TaxID=1416943 RepID=UPI0024810ED5|nr:ABC transporter ATP-binding protein [Liquorilactobacillus sicerae]
MSIELQKITKSYDTNLVLEDISVRIETGEFFAIVGPSGCGKSTLLRMIAGLIPISAGVLKIDEEIVNQLPPQDRKLTMVFQNYALFPFLNVAENVAFGLKARRLAKNEVAQRVKQALELVNLSDFAKRKPRELSGGQRQRVALARAIASDAKVCLMDEPLSNLDAQLRGKMRSEIRELQQQLGLTLIYVTHDQVEAMTMADRIMVLHDQHVQQIGSPVQIYQHPQNTFVADFFGTPRINFLTVQHAVSNQLAVDLFLKFELQTKLPAGTYQIGVRPGDLVVDFNQPQTNATVRNLEYLGTQSVIHAQLDHGEEVRITVAGQLTVGVNQRMLVTAKPNFIVFDQHQQAVLFAQGGKQDGTNQIQQLQQA